METCPQGALRLIGKTASVEEIMALVLRDRAYYERSGGGLTLSGGEPLAQVGFSLALLRTARTAGIHTCMETCGQTTQKRLAELLPCVDLFLFDYKATDPVLHKKLTGVDNRRILSNLQWLLEQGARVVLRCPLAPGINDQPAHLAAIAALSARTPAPERIEIMAYHDLGKTKAEQIGSAANMAPVPRADAAMKSFWLESLREAGCPNVALG